MDVIFYVFVAVGGLFLLLQLGVPGVMMGVGAFLAGLFICGNAKIALFGLVLTLVGFIAWCSGWNKTTVGRKQTNEYTKQIKNTEKEYGIIDYSKKK